MLFIAISAFLLAHSAYLYSIHLSQIEPISSDMAFENQDQEERLPDSEKGLKMYGSSALLIIFRLGTNLPERSSHLFSQTLSLGQNPFVLRC